MYKNEGGEIMANNTKKLSTSLPVEIMGFEGFRIFLIYWIVVLSVLLTYTLFRLIVST